VDELESDEELKELDSDDENVDSNPGCHVGSE